MTRVLVMNLIAATVLAAFFLSGPVPERVAAAPPPAGKKPGKHVDRHFFNRGRRFAIRVTHKQAGGTFTPPKAAVCVFYIGDPPVDVEVWEPVLDDDDKPVYKLTNQGKELTLYFIPKEEDEAAKEAQKAGEGEEEVATAGATGTLTVTITPEEEEEDPVEVPGIPVEEDPVDPCE